MDAESPFRGWEWPWLSLALAALLLALATALAPALWRRRAGWGHWAVLGTATGAAIWTAASTLLDQEVTIDDPRSPGQATYCLFAGPVNWSTDCGHAYAVHLAITLGPTAVMVVAVLAAGMGFFTEQLRRDRVPDA